MSLLRNPLLLLGVNLSAIAGSTYLLRSHHVYNLEEHEARMDELEGTLRGHIGLIEEALDRIEGKATESDKGKKMSVDNAYEECPSKLTILGTSITENEEETESNDGVPHITYKCNVLLPFQTVRMSMNPRPPNA